MLLTLLLCASPLLYRSSRGARIGEAHEKHHEKLMRSTCNGNQTGKPMNDITRQPNGRFLPGNPGGGRPIGARQRLAEQIIKDIVTDWNEALPDGRRAGPVALAKLRVEDPGRYVTAVTGLVPRDLSLTVETNPFDELGEEQVRAALLELQLRRRERAMRTIDAMPAEIPQPPETVTDGANGEKPDGTD